MDIAVYSQKGEESGAIKLPAVFDVPINADLLAQVVLAEGANQRVARADVKGRGEVRGGGKKPWRQKGTGRARHGSIRSPIWKGGGVTHGPTVHRNFKKKINKKMAALALAMAIAGKARDGELVVFDTLSVPSGKTKEAAYILSNIARRKELAGVFSKSKTVILPKEAKIELRAFRNIARLSVENAEAVTARGVLDRKYVIMPKDSILTLERRLAKNAKIKD
ncbi:MAG: 50S ribosomal protein L4 [Candidatus Sungbacteria bacterium]|nr:50S ribosomal protein L4 [Candidatus Sungbacteria bacterium]